jgi:hypothetical protein
LRPADANSWSSTGAEALARPLGTEDARHPKFRADHLLAHRQRAGEHFGVGDVLTGRAGQVDGVRRDIEDRDVQRDTGRHFTKRQLHDLLHGARRLERGHRPLRRTSPRALGVLTKVVAAHQPTEELIRD